MTKKLSSGNIKRSNFSVVLIFTALAVIGIFLIPQIDFRFLPSDDSPLIEITYHWPLVSSKMVEQKITSKVEGVLNTLPGITNLTSMSSYETGKVTIFFDEKVDMNVMRFEVASKIRQLFSELPRSVSYPNIKIGYSKTRSSNILAYAVNAKASSYYIQGFIDDHLKPKLSEIRDLDEISIYGIPKYEWQIAYNMERINAYDVNVEELKTAINNHLVNKDIGLTSYQTLLGNYKTAAIRVKGGIYNENIPWNRIPVKNVKGHLLYLGQIANTAYSQKFPSNYLRVNGENSIVVLIDAKSKTNHLKVKGKVQRAVEDINKHTPNGIAITKIYDSTELLKSELKSISIRMLFSIGFLSIFLVGATRSLRYVYIVLLSLTYNLILSVIVFYLFNVEVNFYSLAGLTISLGMIIDNSLVMVFYHGRTGRMDVISAMWAATLTTVVVLGAIAFLEKSIIQNLKDFAWIISINLLVSISISYYLIPSLMAMIMHDKGSSKKSYRWKKLLVMSITLYRRFILINRKYTWVSVVALVLGFGIPIHLLPLKIEDEKKGLWKNVYNETVGNEWFVDKIRPVINKALGGTFRLFSEHVFRISFYSDPEQTILYLRGSMPEGCTIHQLNDVVVKMENYINSFSEVDLFKTSINSYNNGLVTIYFKPEYEDGEFPYFLKQQLINKAFEYGGVDWYIYGVGKGFSNSFNERRTNYRFLLKGYNYDELYRYAQEFSSHLLQHSRIETVTIGNSIDGWLKDNTKYEFYCTIKSHVFNQKRIGEKDILYPFFHNIIEIPLNNVISLDQVSSVTLKSDTYHDYSFWQLNNQQININGYKYKFKDIANIEKRKSGNDIYKENQEYVLTIDFEFIGSDLLANEVLETKSDEMNDLLPLGYNVQQVKYKRWDKNELEQYLLIPICIILIYIMLSILMESFIQPIAILALVPGAFIGMFLTFYLFKINFDQGGLAAFVLLIGLSVNAGLFILYEYNLLSKSTSNKPSLDLYLKAFVNKIIPVSFMIISTILGLLPFIVLGKNEVFWFAFSAGTIGGLIFSILSILIYIPLILRFKA